MKLRALVIDDDAAVRHMLKRVLETHGYEVVTFSNPRLSPLFSDNAEMCPSGAACVDVIIAELDTPLASGMELVTRQRRKGCKISNIALMSTTWTQGSMKSAMHLGCQVFQKPTCLNEINEWLSECARDAMPSDALRRDNANSTRQQANARAARRLTHPRPATRETAELQECT